VAPAAALSYAFNKAWLSMNEQFCSDAAVERDNRQELLPQCRCHSHNRQDRCALHSKPQYTADKWRIAMPRVPSTGAHKLSQPTHSTLTNLSLQAEPGQLACTKEPLLPMWDGLG
jgi:hypothetical protein